MGTIRSTADNARVEVASTDGSGDRLHAQAVVPVNASGAALGTDASGNQTVVGNVAAGVADSGNPVKAGGKYNLTTPTYADGQRGDLQVDAKGNLRVAITVGTTAFSGAGSADGQAFSQGFGVLAQGSVFNGATWDRAKKPNTTTRIPSAAATTNATSAKASAGDLFHVEAMNTTASVKFLKIYNKASAPTVGTDTPVLTIALPPSNAAFSRSFPTPLYFSTGIAFALTGAAADADATALAAADVVGINLVYQ